MTDNKIITDQEEMLEALKTFVVFDYVDDSLRSDRDAVADLCEAFDKGLLPNSLDDEMYLNIKRMQNINLS